MPRLLRSGRRGREFGRPGRGAAVILLLPAHARGRHLPDRPRPGHLSSRSGGGPRSNRVWEAKAAPAASEPGPRCLLGAAAGVLRSTTLRSPRPGTGQPRRIEAADDTHAGQTPGVQQRGPGPGPLSPALQLTPGGGVVGSAAPQVPLPPRGRDLARRPPPGLRREEETGRAGAGRGGDMEEDSGAAELPLPGRAARGARGDGDVISPQPSPAPRRRRQPCTLAAGTGASRGPVGTSPLGASPCGGDLQAPTWAVSPVCHACDST